MTSKGSATKAKTGKRGPQMRRQVTATPREDIPRAGVRPLRLDSLRRCRLELSNLYREARAGAIPPETATKLAFVARQIVEVLKIERVEQRLDDLESRLIDLPKNQWTAQ